MKYLYVKSSEYLGTVREIELTTLEDLHRWVAEVGSVIFLPEDLAVERGYRIIIYDAWLE